MVKPTGPTNVHQRKLIEKLMKTKEPIWMLVAERLGKSRRKKVEVNVGKIDRFADSGETVVVPGTVLGLGSMSKGVKVAAWRFAGGSAEKISGAKGAAMSIEELVGKNPKGSKVKVMV
jgi:large subunit ribosomal protein L18e